MTERTVTHATFTLERTYDDSPSRAFAAWATPEAKARWFVGPESWARGEYQLDFKVGGRERLSGGPAGGPVHRISVSLATVEFKPTGKGTRLTFTEQGAFLDGLDDPKLRERGTIDLLDSFGNELKRQA